jgi:hypothetical protein
MAKAKSMVAEAETTQQSSNNEIALPVGGNGGVPATTNLVATFQTAPFVNVAHPQSEKLYGRLMNQFRTVNQGDPYLIFPEPLPCVHLNPMRFYYVCGFQYNANIDKSGNILNASVAEEGRQGCYECIESLLLISLPDRIVPANFKGKKATNTCLHVVTKAHTLAQTSDWGNQSAEHKETLVISDYRLRMTCTVTPQSGTAASTGYRYPILEGNIQPTSSAEWSKLQAFFADEKSKKLLEGCVSAYQFQVKRIAEAIEKFKNG